MFSDLFSYFTRKYFQLHKGIRVILNECESSLTYLNVYRKNNLKQLFTQHTIHNQTEQLQQQQQEKQTTNQIIPNKSLSFSVMEEALQANAKYRV